MKPVIKTSVFYLIIALMTMFVACSDHLGNDEPEQPEQPDAPKEWTRVTAPAAIVGELPSDELGEALGQRFSNISDIGNARVALFTGASLQSVSKDVLRDFYEKGNIIVVVNPDNNTDNVLLEDLGSNYTPYCDNSDVLIYAFNNKDRHFLIFNDPELPMPEDEIEETDLTGLENVPDEDGVMEDDDDENMLDGGGLTPIHDRDYFHGQLEGFIDWVNACMDEISIPSDDNSANSVGPDGYNPICDINNNAVHIDLTIPFSLYKKIDKGTNMSPDYLSGNGSVEFNYKIYPLYVHNIDGQTQNAAGDYYIVDGSVTIKSGDMWHPYKQKHGGCNNRIVGFYLTKGISLIELLDENDMDKLQSSSSWQQIAASAAEPPASGHHLSDVQFYHTPLPSTYTGSTTYSEGVTYGMDLTVSGKVNKEGPEVGVSAGFKAEWSNTISQTLPDVTGSLSTPNNSVKYQYNVMNIFKKRDWEKIERNFPLLSRSDLSGRQFWIWKVPAGTHNVDENSDAAFYLKMSFRGYYDSFNWWRGASWDNSHSFPTELCVAVVKIDPPSRVPFGAIAIKNAADETMADIKITDMATGEICEIQNSYGYNEIARIKLRAGKYRVDYNILDPKNHKVVSKWFKENVVVKMGKSEEESTTRISSVNFDPIE